MTNYLKKILFGMGLAISGCANSPDSLVPKATTAFTDALAQQRGTTVTLIHEWEKQDKTLRFLSGDKYSCGDPNSPIVSKVKGIKDASAYVDAQYDKVPWKASVDLITTYTQTLQEVATNQLSIEEGISSLTGVVQQVATFVPASAPAAPAIAPLGNIAKTIVRLSADIQIQYLAKKMEPSLEAAVHYLESPTVLHKLGANEQEMFSLWDECSRERLYYMMELSDRNFNAKHGPQNSDKLSWHPVLIAPNARELNDAYMEYLTQKASLSPDLGFKKKLEEILSENKRIQKNAAALDPSKIFQSGKDVCDAANALSTAAGGATSCATIAKGVFSGIFGDGSSPTDGGGDTQKATTQSESQKATTGKSN